jgi:hypothetical protein
MSSLSFLPENRRSFLKTGGTEPITSAKVGIAHDIIGARTRWVANRYLCMISQTDGQNIERGWDIVEKVGICMLTTC